MGASCGSMEPRLSPLPLLIAKGSLMSNTRKQKSTKGALQKRAVSTKNGTPCAKNGTKFPRGFTAHQFREYRLRRGAIIRSMREKRKFAQDDLGLSRRTVQRIESGEASQVSMMHLLARLVPCPRELLKILRAVLESLPVACKGCRAVCRYKGTDEKKLIAAYCHDVTIPPEE